MCSYYKILAVFLILDNTFLQLILCLIVCTSRASLVAYMVKNLLARQETWV